MSDDTIKRSDAINLCEKWRNRTNEHHDKNGWYIADTLLKTIKELPSADRPQGEWIEIGTISHSYKCSVCGRTLFHITVGKNHVAKYYPYCHCGARMKGADDE